VGDLSGEISTPSGLGDMAAGRPVRSSPLPVSLGWSPSPLGLGCPAFPCWRASAVVVAPCLPVVGLSPAPGSGSMVMGPSFVPVPRSRGLPVSSGSRLSLVVPVLSTCPGPPGPGGSSALPCGGVSVDYKSMAGARPGVIRTDPLFSVGLPDAVTLMEAIDDLPPIRRARGIAEHRRGQRSQRANPRSSQQRLVPQGPTADASRPRASEFPPRSRRRAELACQLNRSPDAS
jgi:hypothetical protein